MPLPRPFRHGCEASVARRTVRAWIAVLALAFVGCGGGGGGSLDIELGTLALVPASVVSHVVTNPFDEEAQLDDLGADAPFSIEAGFLPRTVAANESIDVPIRFAPAAPGVRRGEVRLRFATAAATRDVVLPFRARAETVPFERVPAALDFGTVEVGSEEERTILLVNRSALSTVTIQDLDLPSDRFTLVDGGLPASIAPGGGLALTVRYAPLVPSIADGAALVGPDDLGAAITVPIFARTPGEGSEDVLDLGAFAFDGTGRTEPIEFEVPADAISITIEAGNDAGGLYGIAEFHGPDGRAYESLQQTGPFRWMEGGPLFVATLPNSDREEIQLVSGGGTYRVRIWRLVGSAATVDVRVILERRPVGGDLVGTLPLNVFLVPGIAPNAANAQSDARLSTMLDQIRGALAQQGIAIGDIDFYDLTNGAYDDVSSDAEFRAMLRESSIAVENRLNLFVVTRISMGASLGQTIAGVAGRIAGPRRMGTSVSGVMVIYQGASAEVLGLVAAHELCHYLGLFHTVEANGTHDPIDDTLNCPAQGTNMTCTQPGNLYLMHWSATGGARMSDGQGLVIRRHPCVDPGIPGALKPTFGAAPPTLDAAAYMDALGLGAAWCGTCHPPPPLGEPE